MPSTERDTDILHQADTRDYIDGVIETGVGEDNAAITNAVVVHAFNSTFSDTELEAACNALGTKINLILAALRNNGIVLP